MAPIVFVGIVGNNHATVEHQLEPTLDMAGITEMAIPDDERAAIVKHTKASKQVVKSLHVGGVIAGQLGGSRRAPTFRVLIYDASGNLTSDLESPIATNGLTKHNLEMFAANVADLGSGGSDAAPAPRQRVARQHKAAAVDDAPLASSHTDDDAPPGFAPTQKKSDPVAVAAASPDDDDTASAPAVVEHAPAASHGGHLIHVRVGLLVGVVGRNLATDPNTVQTYSSAPVGTGGFAGELGIGDRVHVTGMYEHTLVMHTSVGSDNASTDIGRGELTAGYDVLRGSVRVAPLAGFGTRFFAIDSASTMRSPDTQYNYLMLGASIAKQLGARWALRGLAAYEPVIGGVNPGTLPAPGRWGFDVGASLDWRATEHVFARAAFDYQSFASSWMVGGATDAYPSGSVTAGAAF